MAKWLALVGILALLTVAMLVYVRFSRPSNLERAEALAHAPVKSYEPLFPAPAFGYTSHLGSTVTTQSLSGKPWVANFIFTTCRTICPLLSARMVQLQRSLAGVDVRFVSFSVDPEHDTPEVLAAYARRWAPDETRWQLLATDAKTLPVIAAGFHVTAEKNKPGEIDPIIHSSVFVLVDATGIVRGVFDSELKDDIKALEKGVRLLARAPTQAAPTGPVSGVELYHSESCATCHEAPELAPALFGRAGARVAFDNGLVATFDEGYVKESLLAPNAKRAKGYPLKMPSYDHLSAEALLVLTRYVLETPATVAAPSEVPVEIDPVCHMQVRATADALAVEHEGHRYVFCSEHCRRRFEATPTAFLAQAFVTELEIAYSGASGFVSDWDINLRNGGTFVKMASPLPVGTVVRLKMTAPQLVFPFELEGRVSRVDLPDSGTETGIAVLFRDFDGDKRQRLATMVERLRR